MPTDAQLIRAARDDPDAFAELYARHAPAVHRFLQARTRADVALELTAETFAQAALSLRRFRDPGNGSAGPWLFGIAKNVLRRTLERERVEARARARLGIEVRVDAAFDRVEERVTADRLRPQLELALAALPPKQRDAVELRVVDELPYAQVASRLGCSELAARVRVTRALGALARTMRGAKR